MSAPKEQHRNTLFAGVLVLLGAIATLWLSYEFWRLLIQPASDGGAIDVRMRWNESAEWFRGRNVYQEYSDAVYPPASYAMFWPILNWFSKEGMRWAWGLVTVLSLGWLIGLMIRNCGTLTRRESWFLALVPLATYPVGATIGNGQVGIVVIAALLAALPLVARRSRSWNQDLWLASLFILALIKPSIAGFFFWIVLFAAGSLRPSLLICAGYAILTLAASIPQKLGPIDLMASWVDRAMVGSRYGSTLGEGSIQKVITGDGASEILRITSINLHSMVTSLGYGSYLAWTTPIAMALLGFWVWCHRKGSVWILIGVTAVVARFSLYHAWYDDVLLLLPFVALIRIFRGEGDLTPRFRSIAGILSGLLLLSLLAPGGVYALPYPWNNAFAVIQTVTWFVIVLFLASAARRIQLAKGDLLSPLPGLWSEQ